MEDARKSKTVSQLPRGSSCSPSCDVWATREFGIPLSELGTTVRGKKVGESLALTIMAESNVNQDDANLANHPKLFKEGDVHVTPFESDVKTAPSVSSSSSSSSSSASHTRTLSVTNDASSSRNEPSSQSARLINAGANFEIEKSDCSRPSSPIDRVIDLNPPEEMDNHTKSYENQLPRRLK